jgi:Uncharacterised nucleotidyltransferase
VTPMRASAGRLWPTRAQEQLLVAALGTPAQAEAEWGALPAGFTLDELEPGSFELLPLVYRNLADAGSEDPSLPRLKGIYRRAWVKNNLLLERTRELAIALREEAIATLFLEGPAFAARYYPELGLRPTSTIHLLVRAPDSDHAVEVLARLGWTERPESGAYPGWRFLFDEAGDICLLRSALAFDFAGDAAPFWQGAVEQDAGGATVLTPSPTDALLAVCVAGLRVGPLPRTQWIADAAMLLRTAEVDWDRLIEIGGGGGQTLRLRAALAYLHRLPATNVPGGVVARLERSRPRPRERLVYALAAGRLARRGRFAGLSEGLAERLVDLGGRGTS